MDSAISPKNLPKVLLLKPPPIFHLFESEFRRHFHFLIASDSPLSLPHFLLATATNVKAMFVTSLGPPITASDVLNHLPSLQCIVTSTAGVDYIDLDECRRRGISVANAADLYGGDCADVAVGLLIDVLRKVSGGDRFVRGGGWSGAGDHSFGRRLRGKRIGIVGFGSIGSKVAKRIEAFGCHILYTSRAKKLPVQYPFCSDVCELAANSDVLVICCALTDQTQHLINEEVLLALGRGGIVVNISPGAVIDEKVLVRFLVEGLIAGAGLDVFEHEPSVPKELFALDNVVLSPHLAACTEESFRDLYEHVSGNLLAFFSNKPLLSPVL